MFLRYKVHSNANRVNYLAFDSRYPGYVSIAIGSEPPLTARKQTLGKDGSSLPVAEAHPPEGDIGRVTPPASRDSISSVFTRIRP